MFVILGYTLKQLNQIPKIIFILQLFFTFPNCVTCGTVSNNSDGFSKTLIYGKLVNGASNWKRNWLAHLKLVFKIQYSPLNFNCHRSVKFVLTMRRSNYKFDFNIKCIYKRLNKNNYHLFKITGFLK